MKIHSMFLITFALSLPHPLVAKPAQPTNSVGNRSFIYTPNPSQQFELFGPGQVTFIGRTSAVVNSFVLVTDMMVTPRTLNLNEAGQSLIQNPHVQIKLYIPSTAHNGIVRLTAFTLNGQPITPAVEPNAPGLFIPPDQYRLTSNFVHLFFNRSEVLNILGPTPGDKNILLQATLGTGNIVTSYDAIKLLSS